MIHKVKLKVRDEERWLTSVCYGYNIKFSDAPNIDKIIQLHQEVTLQLGSDQPLPIEGGFLRLRFSSTDHDQFFYDWLFTSMMEDGGIEFLQNEVETVSRISFWDCYCIGVEEWMNADGAPMGIELLLSPAILKKDSLVHEKVWKITDIHGNTEVVKMEEDNKIENTNEDKKILDLFWSYGEDHKVLKNKSRHYSDVNLHIKTEGYKKGEKASVTIEWEDKSFFNNTNLKKISIFGIVDNNGEAIINDVFRNYSLNLM